MNLWWWSALKYSWSNPGVVVRCVGIFILSLFSKNSYYPGIPSLTLVCIFCRLGTGSYWSIDHCVCSRGWFSIHDISHILDSLEQRTFYNFRNLNWSFKIKLKISNIQSKKTQWRPDVFFDSCLVMNSLICSEYKIATVIGIFRFW